MRLMSAPVLALPDFEKPFDLLCDAYVVNVGAELLRGKCPVVFYSKKLNPTEARYHRTDCKLLAIYLACMK